MQGTVSGQPEIWPGDVIYGKDNSLERNLPIPAPENPRLLPQAGSRPALSFNSAAETARRLQEGIREKQQNANVSGPKAIYLAIDPPEPERFGY
jgi:hypothetical protein